MEKIKSEIKEAIQQEDVKDLRRILKVIDGIMQDNTSSMVYFSKLIDRYTLLADVDNTAKELVEKYKKECQKITLANTEYNHLRSVLVKIIETF